MPSDAVPSKARTTRGADGARIVYDAIGEGTPLVLLHGGFIQDRSSWWCAGYVERLRGDHRLLVIDLRGHGESDRPAGSEAYAADKVCADVVAVLDAENVDRACIWGFSLGAGVALQLACAPSGPSSAPRSQRVDRVALGGAMLGAWTTPESAEKTAAGIQMLARARQAGTIDQLSIPDAHKDFARNADLDVAAALTRAMASWPVIEPEFIGCPALLYAGSENPAGSGVLRRYAERLGQVGAQSATLSGLDHMGEFAAVDQALAVCRAFLAGRAF
jgi:pimeloyl-ACP methyl ester carboxylesterase